MGEAKIGTLVRETLESLCCGNGWSYGAFWSFDQRNSMLLTLQDVYYYEEKMVEIVGNMLQKVHILGEGIVGQVASLGTHEWIFSDANGASEVALQDDFEVHRQFRCGIETISAISVGSHGVVQFGSTKKIPEQPEFISQTRRLFKELESINGLSSALGEASSLNFGSNELSEQWFDSFCSGNITPMQAGSCNELMDLVYRQTDFSKSDILGEIQETPRMANEFQPGGAEPLPVSAIEPGVQIQQLPVQSATSKDVSPCISTWSNSRIATSGDSQWSSTTVLRDSTFDCRNIEQNLHGYSFPSAFHCEELEKRTSAADLGTDSMLLNFSNSYFRDSTSGLTSLMSESFSPATGANPLISTPVFDVPFNISVKEPSYPVLSSVTDAYAGGGVESSVSVSNVEKDLFEGLGLDSASVQYANTLEEIMLMGGGRSDNHSDTLDVVSSIGPRKALFSELGIGEILYGASGWNRLPKVEDQSSPRKRLKMEASSSSVTSSLTHIASGSCSSVVGGIQHLYHPDSSKNLPINKEMPPKPRANLWIDDSYSMIAESSVLAKPKKIEDPRKGTRKRAKPGEGSRPRPKDRQMILDRYAELKNIIPGGDKLTTDGLLDRTIKHLVFLESMASYSNKLKQLDVTKLLDHPIDMHPKENIKNGGGVSWALEVEDESMVCPIIVEDLGPPGLMLIQMFCEDRGFFLEIADMIKDFGLNILKGVTEFKENKIWARFIVEAKTNITRREVIYFLVKFLETNSAGKNDDVKKEPCHVAEGHNLSSNTYQQPAFHYPMSLEHTLH